MNNRYGANMKPIKWTGCLVLMAMLGTMVGCVEDDETNASGSVGGTWRGTMTVNGSSDVVPLALVITERSTQSNGTIEIEVVATANELPIICRGLYYSSTVDFSGTADYKYTFVGGVLNNSMSGEWTTTAGYAGTWQASR